MVLAWIAALAAVIALAPMFAGDFDADFGTNGSESEEVAQLLTDRFDRSGEFVTVAWEGADTPGAQRTVDAFLEDAQRVPGIGQAEGTRVSPDGTIAVTQLQLTRRGWDVPPETGQELIRLADRASTDDVEIALGGVVIQNSEEGGSPEGIGMMAAAVILLIAFGSIVAAGLPLLVALFGLGISASLIDRSGRGRRRARLRARRGRPDRHRRRRRLRAARAHALPRRARAQDAARGDRRGGRDRRPLACWSPARPC